MRIKSEERYKEIKKEWNWENAERKKETEKHNDKERDEEAKERKQ